MKSLVKCLIFLVACLQAVFAQDYIVTKSGEELKVKVEEVTLTDIRYKRFDNLDGPTVVIVKADVFMIKYANGTKDIIKAEAPAAEKSTASPTPEEEKIDYRGGRYYQNNVRLSMQSLEFVMQQSRNKNAMHEMQMAKSKARTGKILTVVGVPFASVGAGMLIFSVLIQSLSNGSANSSKSFQEFQIGGLSSLLLGLGCIGGGIGVSSGQNQHLKKAVQLYNSGLATK